MWRADTNQALTSLWKYTVLCGVQIPIKHLPLFGNILLYSRKRQHFVV